MITCVKSCAVAQHGKHLLVQRRENQFAVLAVGHRFAGLRVDHFPQEMILVDMLHIAAGQAFSGYAGAHHFGQTVIIGADDVHAAFNFVLQMLRARFAAEQAHA